MTGSFLVLQLLRDLSYALVHMVWGRPSQICLALTDWRFSLSCVSAGCFEGFRNKNSSPHSICPLFFHECQEVLIASLALFSGVDREGVLHRGLSWNSHTFNCFLRKMVALSMELLKIRSMPAHDFQHSSLLLKVTSSAFMCWWSEAGTPLRAGVSVWGQLALASPLPSRGFQGSHSWCQAWQQVPLPTGPCSQLHSSSF